MLTTTFWGCGLSSKGYDLLQSCCKLISQIWSLLLSSFWRKWRSVRHRPGCQVWSEVEHWYHL